MNTWLRYTGFWIFLFCFTELCQVSKQEIAFRGHWRQWAQPQVLKYLCCCGNKWMFKTSKVPSGIKGCRVTNQNSTYSVGAMTGISWTFHAAVWTYFQKFSEIQISKEPKEMDLHGIQTNYGNDRRRKSPWEVILDDKKTKSENVLLYWCL